MTEKSSKKAYKGSGANPIKSTIETIPNYPKKLIIFKVESSPYYWSRVYVNGRYSIRSLKTDNRKLAQKGAIKFFTDILVDHRVGVAKPLKSRTFTNVGNTYLETIPEPIGQLTHPILKRLIIIFNFFIAYIATRCEDVPVRGYLS